MTYMEKAIFHSIFERMSIFDDIGVCYPVDVILEDYERFPLSDAIRELTFDIVRKTEKAMSSKRIQEVGYESGLS